MRTATFICLALLLLMFQPALGQPTVTQNCISQEPVNMGDIMKGEKDFVHNGSLSPGETDWLTFQLIEPGSRIFVMVSDADEESDEESDSYTDYGIVVFDENMDTAASSENDYLMAELMPGSYYIRLDARPYEEVNYTLIANGNSESEPNDGLSEANDLGTISESLLFGGGIYPEGDADFFKFNFTSNERAMLRLESESDCFSDMALVLYAYNESKKYYMPEYTGTNSILALLDPGIHYLRILSSDSDNCNYTVKISNASMTCDHEPNDSFEEAVSLGTLNSSNELVEKGCMLSSNDEDYYTFEVLEEMSVTMKTITGGDTKLYLYDSEEDELEYNDDYNIEESRIVRELKPGVYYLKVECYDDMTEYKISVKEGDEEDFLW